MKRTITKSILISATLLTACATKNHSSDSSPVVKSPQVLQIEQRRKQREEAQQDLKDRNMVLNKKSQISNIPTSKAGAGSGLQVSANPQNKKVIVAPILAGQESKLSDRDLYAELVGTYDRNNEIMFSTRFQAFMKKYPRSPLADDAVYLAGLMALSNKNYGPALKYFNQVLKQYPTSNKTSSAMYAKGIALKKMNLLDQSQYVFVQVEKNYPGSPEALRADTELKLLKK